MVKLNERAAHTAAVIRSVEQFDAEHKRVTTLLEKQLRLPFHPTALATARSAPLSRSSPEMSLGRSDSRKAARLRDSRVAARLRRNRGATRLSKDPRMSEVGRTTRDDANVLVVIVSNTEPCAA